MQPETKYLPVNWVDGMQISKDHFIQSQHAMTSQVRDAARMMLTPYNYGLLPSAEPHSLALSLVASELQISVCQAVTPGGIRIEIPAYRGHEVVAPVPEPNEAPGPWAVVLHVNPFTPDPAGQPDPEENPPRMPYTIPRYRLEIKPFSQVAPRFSAYELVVGRLLSDSNGFRMDRDYIPPCSEVASLRALESAFKTCVERIGSGIESCFEIMKILQNDNGHDPQLAENIHGVVAAVLPRMTEVEDRFRLYLRHQAPVFTLAAFTEIARSLENAIRSRPQSTGSQHLLNYLGDSGIIADAGQFLSWRKSLLSCLYDHNDIRQAVTAGEVFLEGLVSVLEGLASMPKYNWQTLERGKWVIKEKKFHVQKKQDHVE